MGFVLTFVLAHLLFQSSHPWYRHCHPCRERHEEQKVRTTRLAPSRLTPIVSDHIPYRNSKLTRLLQPSLSGNARISVICTINPEPSAVSESLSTLGFARRIRGVKVRVQYWSLKWSIYGIASSMPPRKRLWTLTPLSRGTGRRSRS